MTRALTDMARDFVDDLPPDYQEDPIIEGIQAGLGGEYQRLADAALARVYNWFPQHADEETLRYWEAQLNLVVNPAADVITRRTTILAVIRSRRTSSALDWEARITEIVGTPNWSYTVSGYQVTFTLPYSVSQVGATQFIAYARAITPAHLVLAYNFGSGFVLDLSLLDLGTL